MFHFPADRRRHAWIVVLALLWQVLLPLSSAFARASVERHSACAEMERNGYTARDEGPIGQYPCQLAHCALCAFHGSALALHDARNPLVIVATGNAVQRELAAPHSHRIPVSTPPHSRAPPDYT